MSFRRKLLVALPFVVALVIAGCKISTINYFPPHPANVRVVNLMPEAAGIDVSIAGNPAYSALPFQGVTGYQSYDNQATIFSVNVTGSGTILNFTYNLAGEQPYTLLVYGSLTSMSASLLQEVPSAPTNGQIQVAVFNAAINQNSVDIYVTAPGTDITNLNPNYAGVFYNGTSLNLAFAPGTYQIRITTQGTKTVIYDSGGTALTPNIGLSLVAYSKGSGVLVNAMVLQSQGAAATLDSALAQIKAMNGASVVGPVNQLLGTTAIATNIPYATASLYNPVVQGADHGQFRGERHAGSNDRLHAGDAGCGDGLVDLRHGLARLAAGIRPQRHEHPAGQRQRAPSLRQCVVELESAQCRRQRRSPDGRRRVSESFTLHPGGGRHRVDHLYRCDDGPGRIADGQRGADERADVDDLRDRTAGRGRRGGDAG